MNSIKKLFAATVALFTTLFLNGSEALYAQGHTTNIAGKTIWNPTSNFQNFIVLWVRANTILNFLSAFAALVCVIIMLWAGYTYIGSAGDSEAVEKAQKMIQGGAVGLAVVLTARITIEFILGPQVVNI